MSGEPGPAPESCVHNLHRIGDGRAPRPESTDLCRNALGVFHMADCPLTLGLGLVCSYYEAAAEPHATTGDLELETAREELQRDFLGWRYRRRARWLTKPRNLVPVLLSVESAPEPEEVVPETLAMRLPPVAASAEGGAPPVPANGAAALTSQPITTEVATMGPVVAAAPERYPGQRRSEERLAKKRARLAARDAAAAAAAKAAQIAAVTGSATAEGPEDEGDDDGFGGDLAEDVEPVDEGPKTVEQVLAALPDAPVGPPPQRRGGGRGPGGGGGGPGGGGPPRDGQPRHRRRRGRRGRGGGGGGGGGGGPGGPPRPQGPRPSPRPPG
jgi:hypothetical protein